MVQHAPVRAGHHLPQPDEAVRVPDQPPRRGVRRVRPVLRRLRLRPLPLGLRQRHQGRRVGGPDKVAHGTATVAAHGRARPLPRRRANWVGLPEDQQPRRGLGQRPPRHSGSPEHVRPRAGVHAETRHRLLRAVPDLLPPQVGRRRAPVAGPGAPPAPDVAHGVRGRAAAGRSDEHPGPGSRHRAVQGVRRLRHAELRAHTQQHAVPHPRQHHAAVPEGRLLPAAAGRLPHATVGVRLDGGRLHSGVLPHGVGVQAVPVASPQGRPPQVLRVHPDRGREAAQREHRGRAPGDPSGHGGADATGGDQAHPEFVVR